MEACWENESNASVNSLKAASTREIAQARARIIIGPERHFRLLQ
jgi:hypothetical protein